MEGDGKPPPEAGQGIFQSTPSAWRVTALVLVPAVGGHISIHTLRMEGDLAAFLIFEFVVISIHTLRMEGDSKSAQKKPHAFVQSNRPAEKLPTGRA